MLRRIKKPTPFAFVLDLLEPVQPFTRAMFGCTALYLDDKIVLILRDKEDYPRDNGVWLATTAQHHDSLRRDLPSIRSIELFGGGPTGWQNLPADAPDFEESVRLVCKLVKKGDPRIGKIPLNKRKPRKARPKGV